MDRARDYSSKAEIDEQPVVPTQAELEAMFDADEGPVAAGRTVPIEPVFARMRQIAEQIRRERRST